MASDNGPAGIDQLQLLQRKAAAGQAWIGAGTSLRRLRWHASSGLELGNFRERQSIESFDGADLSGDLKEAFSIRCLRMTVPFRGDKNRAEDDCRK